MYIQSLSNLEFYFIASISFDANTNLDPPKCVHHLTVIFAISVWFSENKSRFLIYFSIQVNISILNNGYLEYPAYVEVYC